MFLLVKFNVDISAMEIIILGSGSSIGVPVIGCGCKTCISDDPRNKRSRASIIIKWNDYNLLVDTSPDLWMQAINNGIKQVDAVIFTHEHADHIAGIDNLRSFNFLKDGPIDIYGCHRTLDYIEQNYSYCFAPMKSNAWYKPYLISHRQKHGDVIRLGGKDIGLFLLNHGGIDIFGLRIDKTAYTTDLKMIPEESSSFLEDLDLWIIDCLKYETSPGHLSLDEALALIAKYKPRKAVLCHLAHELEYSSVQSQVPSNVQVAFDGLALHV
jgi:phosphoribosyl 1,2-cyclic phosphate phosphodiesterase